MTITPEPIYAVGDVHGCLEPLKWVIAAIQHHAGARGIERPRVVFLGDYVDRGPDSKGVVDLLSSPELGERFDAIFLQGNHDAAMLQADREHAQKLPFTWLAEWGGAETLESYGVEIGGRAWSSFMLDFHQAIPAAHRAFLGDLKLCWQEVALFFCHAGIAPGIPIEEQSAETLLFGVKEFLDYEGDYGSRIVHGHWVTQHVDVRPNRIGVDTGCGYPTRQLSAVAILGTEVAILP